MNEGRDVSEATTFTDSRAVTVRGESLLLRWGAVTHVGRKREVNQDSVMGEFPLFAVADGMGGYAAGELASGAVVKHLSAFAQSNSDVTHDGIEASLRDAIVELAAEDDIDVGTGTTVTGIAFTSTEVEPFWTVFNIGDSRVYVEHDGELAQVTTDHSVVQELIAIGAISPDDAENHPQGNVITRAVGFTDDPVPDYLNVPIEKNTRWVICSDGLTKELTDYGILHFLERAPDALDAANLMVEAAVENGGRDNVTVLVLDVIAEEAPVDQTD
ncbi:PP2C family protein-serine/threonine phosphatase [Paramicrobacterium chengjingii]|uniref:Serine/threonine-protein phosphatase n=1 Tax=Paramicrobacterium chengjingii TaxID=2769067 RepID=A0ABX6YEK9_9MICO|nr:protein phosphatase 2C domain-containing protein [Microbacterium chengjingii]QPZ37224.1 serine/threonine-protein phosphatase [Microbacterium chengjingii]